jgi:peptidyl-prolyl cis-trans isomerase A (cyclophilin A)
MMRTWVATLLGTALLLGSGAEAADFQRVRIETTAGDIIVELDRARAPLTVENFLQYMEEEFYDGTIFHRVMNGFVIQGGGYAADLKAKTTYPPIPNESGNGLGNERLTIAMARTNDPHTADSQFYINLADNSASLDPKPTRWGYTVFGRVVEGSDVVDDIGHRATQSKDQFPNLPTVPVVIEKVSLVTDAPRQ